jgi:filamentous hemagglutinin
MKTIPIFLRQMFFWARNFLASLAVIFLLLEQLIFLSTSSALAAELPITPDGSTNTKIDRAANNVPIVNIARPNAGGLSHNKFHDYNVNQSGLILNNAIGSKNGVVQTQIGGLINDNANLAKSGAASVILNEVTSNNISHINGYTEIAGKKADLVLANPNGFVMNGAGFINVSRFSAVVGSSNQFNPNPNDLTFRLSDNAYAITHGFLPKLTIMGTGIYLENVTSTDLVANVMNIVAPIYGGDNDISLRTGDASFNYLTKTVTSDNTTPGNNLPDEVAIDASALGKIQAGRIFIVATKEGFGIKYSGDLLASRAGITIDNQGNIDYNNALSEVGNIEVTSQKGSITQSGISQTKNAGDDLTLNAFGDITNYGQFLSGGDIDIDSGTTFNNQSADLNLADNDFTISAVNFTNLGQISANRDLSITATNSLTNSAQLVGGRNLTLTAPQITNNDSIYAGNKINITATNYLTNNKDIISLGMANDDGITINAKTLNNNKRIAAKNNININSNVLNNNTSNSSILALNNINLNATSIDNRNASIQAANNLTLRNLALNASDIAALFLVTNQATNITNTGGNFYAGSLLDFDLGNADYTILGSLQAAGNIKIKAVNVTNQTNLQAKAAIEIIATDKFVNGVLSGDNSNNKIAAGTALSITAANLLSNYGTLSSNTDLTLTSTSSNINNNVNAEIIGGTGRLTLSAKNGTVYQNSLHSIVANGDYSLDVTDFVNTGRVDVAGNLTLNVANNLTNAATAMIYAGGNMELNVVNNLTNNSGAVIFSEGNLTIQKYALTNPLYNSANNKSNLVKNISGQIISYGGNMRIDAQTISNERAINPFNSVLDPQTNGTIYGADSAKVNQYSWQLNNNGCFGHNCENRYWGYYARQLTNSGSIASWIQSGGTLTVNAGTLDNLASNISAVGNITINADTLNNHSINDPGLYYMTTTWGARDVYSLGTTNYIRHDPGNGGHSGSRLNYNDFAQNNPSTIKSGGSITLNVTNNVSNATTNSNAATSAIATETPSLTNSLNVSDVTTNGTISVDLSNYFSGPDTNGLFQKSANSNGPLFETRSEFLDQSRFFGSDYFYQRIGLNLTNIQTQFEQQNKVTSGDKFYEIKALKNNQYATDKNNRLLAQSEVCSNGIYGSKCDKIMMASTRQHLEAEPIENVLADQTINATNNLDRQARLIGDQFFQTRIIEEQLRTISKNSFLLSAGEINVNNEIKSLLDNAADEYTRLGLTANAPLTKAQINSLQKDIVWFETEIINGEVYIVPKVYLSQATKDNLKNNITISATIYAAGDVNINSSGGKITNAGSITGNNVALTSSGDILNKNFSNITALGALSLTSSAGSINNFSQLKAGGTASLSAAKDVTNSSTVLTNDSSLLASGISGYVSNGMASSNTGFIQSKTLETAGITAGSLTLNAGNDFNNYDANITTTGNADITAGNNANFSTLELRNRTETSWGHKSKGGSQVVDTTTNVASNINIGGNLNVVTTGLAADAVTDGGSNINIIGSNVSTTGNLNLAAKDNVNIASAIDTYHKEERSNSKSFTVKKTYFATTDNTTNVSSNLTSQGDVNISSGKDTNIIASNITGKGNGDILVGAYTDYDTGSATYGQTLFNADANLNILNGVDTKRFYSESTKTKTGLSLENALMNAAMVAAVVAMGPASVGVIAAAGAGGGAVGAVNQQKTTNTTLRYDETIVKSNLSFGKNLDLTSTNDTTIQASNITTGTENIAGQKDLNITTGGNLLLTSATENHQTSYELKDKGNYFFKNGSSGNVNTKVVNTEIDTGKRRRKPKS